MSENICESKSEEIVLCYTTWGTYGQYSRDIAVLKSFEVIDAKKVADRTEKGDSFTMKFGDVEVKVVDKSSRKNKHVYVHVPREAVLAVIHDGATSSGWKGFSVKGEGEVVGEVERREFVNGNKKVIEERKVYYYVYKDVKIKIHESKPTYSAQLIAEPIVYVKKRGDKYVVTGDTFHVKEELKRQGGRWDWLEKAWILNCRPTFNENVKVIEQ
ncbi:MAG: hypothetical protein QW794_08340 [Thermosphaera sp.]